MHPRRSGNHDRTQLPTAAMMAGLTDHAWTFDELCDAVLRG